ncbi:ECF transporter S component [Papillibacter cinnamivorans]|uniref:Uncharacterized membrane protein n=1 Tax=Papillibacter cinnamivorans DSM 12816 TaxID=1122930 RepID=A0A1W2CQN1_9FIRM|nr:ECF transporter S component [Papillibacter cinnamivorans]SMC87567.1 Uncharacterized membrane protein [Papillibacter cinnamivorans DSM 12816]
MRTRKITYSAIAAAIVFLVTWIVKLPVPGTSGAYLNFGDVVITMTAFLLGGPAAAASAAVGSCLADIAVGSAVYAVPTFFIKGLMALACGAVSRKKTARGYILSGFVGGAIMTAGYGLFEIFFFGTAYAAVSLPFNLIQWFAGAAAAAVLLPAVRRLEKGISL